MERLVIGSKSPRVALLAPRTNKEQVPLTCQLLQLHDSKRLFEHEFPGLSYVESILTNNCVTSGPFS